MIICGDSLEVLKTLEENSIDACVTDSPYGLSFMGKRWDYDVPKAELWSEVFRVLKPGGMLLSFGGTRTYHRMVVAIEDSGFEIRDQIAWLYGSGFPKSLDVSKAIDKAAGAEREVIGLKDSKGRVKAAGWGMTDSPTENLTTPATDAAKQWQGFGTALKPANEPIVLARKPLSESTVAKNVLKWGCGALNIDGSRIAFQSDKDLKSATFGSQPKITSKGIGAEGGTFQGYTQGVNATNVEANPQGRWPANVLFDETAAEMLDEQSGISKSQGGRTVKRSGKYVEGKVSAPGEFTNDDPGFGDVGGASRFFYCAKSSKRERNAGLEGMPEREAPGSKRSTPAEGRTSALGAPRANHHPTVKPIKLMEYLCKLITPPGGTVLDPFAGSGSTGVAAVGLNFKFIGIEREKEYCEIANKRIAHAEIKDEQLELNDR